MIGVSTDSSAHMTYAFIELAALRRSESRRYDESFRIRLGRTAEGTLRVAALEASIESLSQCSDPPRARCLSTMSKRRLRPWPN